MFVRKNGCWIFQNPGKVTVPQLSLTEVITAERHILLEWGRKCYEIWCSALQTTLVPACPYWNWYLTAHTETVLGTNLQNSFWLTLLILFTSWERHGCCMDNLIRWIIQILPFMYTLILFRSCSAFLSGTSIPSVFPGEWICMQWYELQHTWRD